MKTKQLLLLCAAFAAAVLTSCSNDSATGDILRRIPASADYVVVGDAKSLIESAGGSVDGSKVKLPAGIVDGLPTSDANSLDEGLDFLKVSGVDVGAVAMTGSFKDRYPTIVFHLTDKKKFEDAITDNGFREKDSDDGVVFFQKKVYESTYDSDYDDYGYIAIADDYAYWIERVWVKSDFKAIKTIGRMVEDAREKSFADTPYGKYVGDGNVGGFAVRLPGDLRRGLREAGLPSSVAAMYDGVVCGNLSTAGDKADMTICLFDNDGKRKSFKDSSFGMDMNAKISGKALSFMGKDESVVIAGAVKDFDWDAYFDMISNLGGLSRSEKAALTLAKSYCEKLNGTVAVGFGLTNGLESIFNLNMGKDVLNQIAATIVVETKDGKAKGMLNDLKDFLEAAEVTTNATPDGFSFVIPDVGGAVYCQVADNLIVVSNHKPRSGDANQTVKAAKFTDHIFAAGLALDKSNPLMRDLSLDNKVDVSLAMDAGKSELALHIGVTGKSSGGIIANIVKMVNAIVDQESSLEGKWREYRSRHYGIDYYGTDSTVVEEVPVEEYAYADTCVVADSIAY